MNLPEKYGESFKILLQQVIANDAQRYQEVYQQLTEVINYLIVHDFERLVQLLYLVDVDERKLKQALQKYKGTDAANVIAEMVLQRQVQKIITKEKFKNNSSAISDEEKW